MIIALVAAGLAIGVLSHVWMFLVLWQEDRVGAVFSAFSSFYRSFYMYTYADAIWRQLLLSLVGALMILTGMGLSMTRTGAARVGGD